MIGIIGRIVSIVMIVWIVIVLRGLVMALANCDTHDFFVATSAFL